MQSAKQSASLMHFFSATRQTTLANEVTNKNSKIWESRIIFLGPYDQQMLQYTQKNTLLFHSTVFFLLCHISIFIFTIAIQAFIHLGFFLISFLTYNVYFFQDTYRDT